MLKTEHGRKENPAGRREKEEQYLTRITTECPQTAKSENNQIRNGIHSTPAHFLPYEMAYQNYKPGTQRSS
jgi:hypothetical protein